MGSFSLSLSLSSLPSLFMGSFVEDRSPEAMGKGQLCHLPAFSLPIQSERKKKKKKAAFFVLGTNALTQTSNVTYIWKCRKERVWSLITSPVPSQVFMSPSGLSGSSLFLFSGSINCSFWDSKQHKHFLFVFKIHLWSLTAFKILLDKWVSLCLWEFTGGAAYLVKTDEK